MLPAKYSQISVGGIFALKIPFQAIVTYIIPVFSHLRKAE